MRKLITLATVAMSACVATPANANPLTVMCQQRAFFAESVMKMRHSVDDINISMNTLKGDIRNDMVDIVNEAYTYPREGDRFRAIRSAAEFGVEKRVECLRDWRRIIAKG